MYSLGTFVYNANILLRLLILKIINCACRSHNTIICTALSYIFYKVIYLLCAGVRERVHVSHELIRRGHTHLYFFLRDGEE